MTSKQAKKKPAMAAAAPAPPATKTAFPIVGIGASAGGLAAFQAFFSGMPANTDPGMAFVLVQHLDPQHHSILAELITRCTPMPVFEAVDGVVVKANCVYIIPPNHDMAILDGALQLFAPSVPRGQRLPIDYFLRSLAVDQRENGIAIVLSGTGSDGSLGVRAIKAEGGMVLVQTPESAEFDGMPRNAIATGDVDYQLKPAEMPERLMAYAKHAFRTARLPAPGQVVSMLDSELNKIFVLLRAQTGHDFSLYKPNTLVRRIQRRMAVKQIEKIEDYVMFLQKTPQEVEALFRDILIGVTNFFRDPQAFEALDAQIGSRLLAGKQPGERVRIWLPACSSGEEAYSVAILLQERMRNLKQSFAVQLFATDIDSRAIAKARASLYPPSIAADVTQERLQGFFTIEPGGGYRVRKVIRDMITFSEQDVIKDPPFSQLDLISCRNLLIYLRAELQVKLLRLFHYALNPGGILFLGNAEGVGETDGLFSVLDGKSRLFLRNDNALQRAPANFIAPLMNTAVTLAPHTDTPAVLVKRTLGEETEQALLQLLAPACALVEGNGDILHLRGRTGMYLEPTPGDVGIINILRMAREGLAPDLRLALHQAAQSREVVRRGGLRVRTNGHFTRVNLTVSPVLPGTVDVQPSNRYLVVLEEAPLAEAEAALESPGTQAAEPDTPNDVRVAALKLELGAKEKLLRSALEDNDTTTEELRSAIEEMQSVNEELQASNEELATSKEELQSANEELATVNVEQQNNVADLARALNDNRNLLAGSGIATVFVDLQQRILSFTPSATAIFKLVATDVGRPLSHFVTNLQAYDRLTDDITSVLDTLATKETKVQDKAGRWYMLRILPYRTIENVIEGAAISFVDISEVTKAQVDIVQLQQALAKLKESEQRFRAVVSALSEGVVMQGADGCINTWNPAAERILGLSGEQLLGLREFDADWHTIHEDGSPFPLEAHPGSQVLKTGVPQHDVTMGVQRPGKPMLWMSVTALPIRDPNDAAQASVVVSFADITERKRLQDAFNLASEDRRLATVVRDANDAITLQSMDGRILAWNPAAQRLYGWTAAEALQLSLQDRLPHGQSAGALEQLKQLGQAKVLEPYRSQRLTKQGTTVEVSITATALRNEAGELYAIATTERLIQGGTDE